MPTEGRGMVGQQRVESPRRDDTGTDRTASARLVAERRRLERDLQALERPVAERCPADIVDLAEAALHREALVERAEALRMRRDALEHAEERLAAGVYGRCEVCADAINEDRLMILPTTDRCVRHAGRR